LICSVYTRDLRRAFVFGKALRSGIVNINETPDYWEAHVPYGGAAGTSSGLGRLGGMNTLREMLDVRSMIIDLGAEGR
jgi:succinate-semialdehyde dehydrogenase/glutarate-semialdehyde dehydrogenase